MTRVEAPSGATSFKRTATRATGLSTAKASSTTGMAENLATVVQRQAVEAERHAVIGALIRGIIAIAAAIGAPFDRARPQVCGDFTCSTPPCRLRAPRCSGRSPVFSVLMCGLGQCAFGDPAAGPFQRAGIGRIRIVHPGDDLGIAGDAGIVPLQPLIPPAQGFLQEAGGRSRQAVMRIGMTPGPDPALHRRLDMFAEPRHRVGIAVLPTAHGKDGAFDGVVILDHRGLAPIGVAPLMARPRCGTASGSAAAAPATSAASASPTSSGSGGSTA